MYFWLFRSLISLELVESNVRRPTLVEDSFRRKERYRQASDRSRENVLKRSSPFFLCRSVVRTTVRLKNDGKGDFDVEVS